VSRVDFHNGVLYSDQNCGLCGNEITAHLLDMDNEAAAFCRQCGVVGPRVSREDKVEILVRAIQAAIDAKTFEPKEPK
jgi:hypothetical protein